MNRNISEICLEIGETVKCSGASPETYDKVDSLLTETNQAKNEINPNHKQVTVVMVGNPENTVVNLIHKVLNDLDPC